MLNTFELGADANENKILSTIVEKTFDGFRLLSDTSGRHNNFLERIGKIELLNDKSESYRDIFILAVNETSAKRQTVFDDITKLSQEALTSVGLTNNSLKLKVQLFREKLTKLRNEIVGFADFGNLNVVQAFLEELNELKNILKSLKMVVPTLEPLIELLQVLMSLLKKIIG